MVQNFVGRYDGVFGSGERVRGIQRSKSGRTKPLSALPRSRRCVRRSSVVLAIGAEVFSVARGFLPPSTKIPAVVTVITARSALYVSVVNMGGDNLTLTHLCPSCGRLMGLARTIAASSGYRELHTYGCRECGVWVTEDCAPRDRLKETFMNRKRP